LEEGGAEVTGSRSRASIVIAATLLLHFSASPVAPSSVCSILVFGFCFPFWMGGEKVALD
jgi:hypothetical protein